MSEVGGHYLRDELYALVKSDAAVFDFLQRGSLDGIWYWDIESPEHEWMSPAFWETLGHDPTARQHLAAEWQDLIHPDDLATALENFERHCADPDHPYDQIVRYKHRDGSTVWVRCRGMAIRDADGKPLRLLGAHTDITELKRTEAELRAALESNRELEQYAYVASHDLREPLRTIAAYLDLLEITSGDALDDSARKYVKTAKQASRRVQRLVSGLLDHARIAAAVEPRAPVDASAVLARALANLDVMVGESGAEISYEPLPTVEADARQLENVLQTLLANAIEHRGDGRPEIEVRSEGSPGWVTVHVLDNGPGIPEEAQERIFNMFQRLEPADEATGVGIGLANARRIVERHGGSMWVDSTPGEGSCFSFTLPDRGLDDARRPHAPATEGTA